MVHSHQPDARLTAVSSARCWVMRELFSGFRKNGAKRPEKNPQAQWWWALHDLWECCTVSEAVLAWNLLI